MMKNVYITGSSRGIGKSIKEKFDSNNWNTNDHDSKILDLENSDDVVSFYKDEFSKNPPNSLILNASDNKNILFDQLNQESIDSTIKINLTSTIYIIQNALENMIHNKFGRIVLIGSIWSKNTRPSKSIYSITKSSLAGLCSTLTIEYAQYNILTNILSPGFVETEMTANNLSEKDKEEFIKRIPQKRFAKPSEIADLAYFMGSDQNTYITGQEIFVDGGFRVG